MSKPESDSDLVKHLTAGDNYLTLITKAGGLHSRRSFLEWLEVAVNLALQSELFYGFQIVQLKKTLEENLSVELKAEEETSGAPEDTAGNSKPPEGSASTIAALLEKQRKTGDKQQ